MPSQCVLFDEVWCLRVNRQETLLLLVPPGYFAINNTFCKDVDECNSTNNNCDANAQCSNTQGSFRWALPHTTNLRPCNSYCACASWAWRAVARQVRFADDINSKKYAMQWSVTATCAVVSNTTWQDFQILPEVCVQLLRSKQQQAFKRRKKDLRWLPSNRLRTWIFCSCSCNKYHADTSGAGNPKGTSCTGEEAYLRFE